MGIILIIAIGISTVYFIRWINIRFEVWLKHAGANQLKFHLIEKSKVVVIIIIAIIALFLCLIAATFDYSLIFDKL